jgi:Domain of unknown function (DUF4331)
MTFNRKWVAGGGIFLFAAPLLIFSTVQFSTAADHLDPPTRTNPALDTTPDTPADIADVYTWHTADSLVIAMTFAGPQPTTAAATFDRDVLYTVNISNAAPRTSTEIPIQIRFGSDGPASENRFGVQFSGLPGVTGSISGPVDTNLSQNGVTVRAGLFDDPFFFDLQGFNDTRSTGALAFRNSRDFFAGQNLTAIVMEIPLSRISNGANTIDVWGETARLGGNL